MTGRTATVNSPRVSVLMTVYNGAPYLDAAIVSLLRQTFQDWELIAVENGSTDASLSVLQSYADPRIRIFELEKNIGRTPALRYAFDRANASYIAVLDADDVSAPDRFMRQVDYLDQHSDTVLVASWAQYIDESGKVFGEFEPPVDADELYDSLGWTNPVVHSSVMYRKQLAQAVGGYPAEIVWAQDFALFLELVQHGRMAMIAEHLCQLRVLRASMTRSPKNQMLVASEAMQLYSRAAEKLRLSAKSRRLNRRTLAISGIRLGVATIRSGQRLAGMRMALGYALTTPSALWANGPVRRFFGAKF